ncbi:MAG: very-short-patch-repair endonuclease [Porticoccaceae bacterium]|jgi:very-short-patch-repair endonuclease
MTQGGNSDSQKNQGEDSLAKNSLERIRQRLVDTSARNRLINCSLERLQVVRLVNELPDQVYARLIDDKPFDMTPVPAPTHRELVDEEYIKYDEHTDERVKDSYPNPEVWARRHGINTAYNLPAGVAEGLSPTHSDDTLQTLLFPDKLNTRLGKIRQLAQTAMEESGTNILYLALGFLEWYESPNSDRPRLSPLFVVPVDLKRSKRVSVDGLWAYKLSLRDDSLLSNISLSQRLKQDFGIELPTVTDDSEPESYLASVSRMMASMDTRWRVRRYAALCLLDFTKQLMYEDLDPARWPADKSLAEHPLLQHFLASTEDDQQRTTSEPLTEHLIDDIDDIHSRFPLIYEADSSQHSALIDVVNGRNLVIEGPPGTGKSQTITNLIAACINNGLSVLFVAEKLAALEVVKRRLDLANLGDFCLEVHSHKSNKLAILNSLMDSHNRREFAQAPADLQQQINRYEGHKESLHQYAEKLNTPWQNSELTPHQILQRATDYSERSPLPSGIRAVSVEDASLISASSIAETLDAAERLQVVFDAVAKQTPGSTIDTHPWFGVRNANLAGEQRQALLDALEQWSKQQRHIMDLWSELQLSLHIECADTPNQETLLALMNTLKELPADIPETLLQRIEDLRDNQLVLDSIEQKRLEYRKQFSDLAAYISTDDLLNQESAAQTSKGLVLLRDELGLTGSAPLEKVHSHREQLDILVARVDTLTGIKSVLEGELPEAFDDVFNDSINGMNSLIDLLDITKLLPANLWKLRDDRYADYAFTQALDHLEPIILSLKEQKKTVSDTFTINQLPDRQYLEDLFRILSNAGIFGFLNSTYKEAKTSLKRLSRLGVKTSKALDMLPELIRYQEGVENLADEHHRNPILGSAFAGLDTNLSQHRELSNWYQAVSDKFGRQSIRESPKVAALIGVNEHTAELLMRAAASDLNQQTSSLVNSLEKLKGLYPLYFIHFSNETSLLDPSAGLKGLVTRINASLSLVGNSIVDSGQSISDLIEQTTRWSNCANDHYHWTQEETYKHFVPSVIPVSAHPEIDDSRAITILSAAQYLGTLASSSTLFFTAIQKEPTLSQLSRLRNAQSAFNDELNTVVLKQEQFETAGNVNRNHWLSDCEVMVQSHARNLRALQQADWLDSWLSYQRVKQRAGSRILIGLTTLLESGSLSSGQSALAVEADLYQQLATHIMSADTELAEMDGNEIQAIRQQFQRYDKELLSLQREQIAANCSKKMIPDGNIRGAVSSYSEFSLIRHEAAKKKRHVAIRSLLKRAPAAIRALKPCFMMSPMSVAQYLEPGQYEFDVIVMDEASQIRPEEALGAIARAKQLVVVGDPKQLPPTSFFNRIASDDDQHDDEVVGVQRAESILDAVIPIFPTRRLRWHYRSRHESLIAFSNQKFYDADLVLFPSPFNDSEEYGINFTRLENATFKESVNLVEAERIVDILAYQLMSQPTESVGVVAMNIKQRDQIEALLERRLSSDELLQRALERNQDTDEPLFIKNLENVQGDERDVIIISMTYGPEMAGGVTYQRFGPINSDVGWRRLNVLLTRSKKRMEIVSSMGSGDIRADSNSKLGVQSLRDLLGYCETGHLKSIVHTGRQPDSAFELAVIRKLAAAGYTAEPQVGTAGFFIDLAVRNPDKPGEFLMGIECDGATYHSAKSARDRDRLRQEVLENLGWQIRRIWSTDWFRNPDAQLRPLLVELEQMRGEV